MYNYHADIVWAVNAVLLGMLIVTSAVIFACVAVKDWLWRARGRALANIKRDVYEMVLAGKTSSEAVCQSFTSTITPQQFIDIATNRSIDAAFFNDSEQQLLKSCFVNPVEVVRFEKIAMRSKNKWRRIEAILCLGYIQTPDAIRILKNSLSSRDDDTSYFSMVSLGQIKKAESARVLIDFLKKYPSAGYKIVSILESFPKDIFDDIIKLTEYHDSIVRMWAVKLLSKFSAGRNISKIEKLTHDVSDEVRAAACDCLGAIGNKEARPTLLKCLKDDSWRVRQHAVLALSKLIGDAAILEVIKLINDPSWVVVDAVRDVMTEHIEAALPYIEGFLDGEYEVAKKYSVLALENSGYLLRLLKDAVSADDNGFAIRLLRGVMRSRSHAGLDAALGNLDPASRDKILALLVKVE